MIQIISDGSASDAISSFRFSKNYKIYGHNHKALSPSYGPIITATTCHQLLFSFAKHCHYPLIILHYNERRSRTRNDEYLRLARKQCVGYFIQSRIAFLRADQYPMHLEHGLLYKSYVLFESRGTGSGADPCVLCGASTKFLHPCISPYLRFANFI